MSRKSFVNILKLTVITITPLSLLLLPADFFDHGNSLCISRIFFDIECYGCGLTRAIMHLIHLDFEEAFVYNMLSFIVLPVIILLWVQWFFIVLKKVRNAMHSIPAH